MIQLGAGHREHSELVGEDRIQITVEPEHHTPRRETVGTSHSAAVGDLGGDITKSMIPREVSGDIDAEMLERGCEKAGTATPAMVTTGTGPCRRLTTTKCDFAGFKRHSPVRQHRFTDIDEEVLVGKEK